MSMGISEIILGYPLPAIPSVSSGELTLYAAERGAGSGEWYIEYDDMVTVDCQTFATLDKNRALFIGDDIESYDSLDLEEYLITYYVERPDSPAGYNTQWIFIRSEAEEICPDIEIILSY